MNLGQPVWDNQLKHTNQARCFGAGVAPAAKHKSTPRLKTLEPHWGTTDTAAE